MTGLRARRATSNDAGAVTALQAALAAEHAAVYGYGVAGAQLSGSAQHDALRYWSEHQKARDTLTAMIAAHGATPVAAQAAYDVPFTVHDSGAARRLAARLEDGVARAYLALVAEQSLREYAAKAMQPPAERAAFWRGTTTAFPGFP